MKLSPQQKRELIAKFSPILVREDKGLLPCDPAESIRQAELWTASAANPDDKLAWGHARNSARAPVVERGLLDPGRLGGSLPGVSDGSTANYWLNRNAWTHGTSVSHTSRNTSPSLLSAVNATFATSEFPVFRAEVLDETDWEALSNTFDAQIQLALNPQEIRNRLQETIALQYYFFFPQSSKASTQLDIYGMHQLVEAYQGDWKCFLVYLTSVGPTATMESLVPVTTGLSSAEKTVSSSPRSSGFNNRFVYRSWQKTGAIGDHSIVAAIGPNNTLAYLETSSDTSEPQLQPTNLGFGEETLGDPIESIAQDLAKKGQAVNAAVVSVTLAKMAVGYSLAGPIGAFVGLVAGIAEADSVAEAAAGSKILKQFNFGGKGKTKDESAPKPPPISVPKDPLVVKDADVDLEILSKKLSRVQSGTEPVRIESHHWLANSHAIIDFVEEPYFWQSVGLQRIGFQGRWGVRCEADPFQRRAGGLLPDFTLLGLSQVYWYR